MKTKILLLAGLLLATFSCKKDKPSVDLQKGLVSYFNFDDNFKDQKGYASDGVPTGNPTFTAGKIGKALTLNGTSQYVNFTANPSQSPTGITIAFWMAANTPPVDGFLRSIVYVADKNNKSVYLVIDQSNKIFSTIYDQSGAAESSFTPGVWTHVLMTYNGNDNKLYINGVLADTLTGVGDVSAYFSAILLGKILNSNKFFQGSIDELYIYNRPLSPAEVTQLYTLK
jgi:hypothetical protein